MTEQPTPANVVPLRPEAAPEQPPVDGEVVTTEPRPTWGTRRVPQISDDTRQRLAEQAVQLHHRTTPTVVTHAAYIRAGLAVARRRRREARSTDPYVRALHAAEANGDWEAVERWADRLERSREARHKRRMDWLRSPALLAKYAALATACGVGLLLALGVLLAVSGGDAALVVEPIAGVVDAIAFAWWFATTYAAVLAVAGPAAALVWLDRLGKQHGQAEMPQWVRSADGPAETSDDVDETSILGALRHLGLKPLTDAAKRGWGTPQDPTRVWEMGLGRDGKGWRCQIRLPRQCPVSEVARKKEVLAHNLGRLPVEVWVSEPKNQPGVMDLWIADQGLLTGPVPDWPLLPSLDTASSDYFAGVPVAVNLRGDVVTGEVAGKNWAVAGMMGSGKSSLVITALLGLILDPLVEADVFVCAQNGDYEMMRPRLRQLVTGATDATVEAALANLRELYEELEVRGQALREHTEAGDPDAEKVTRRLAEADPRLRPRVMVVDECQALFMHEEHGAEAQRLAILLMNASRKYAITLIFLTPEPSTDSLPRKLTAVMSTKACFAIGDQQSNDAILGTSSYKRGISAVGLEPATSEGPGDVGTAMTSSGLLAKPGLIRSFFVPRDRHGAIVDRALALRTEAAPAPAPTARDLLADVAAVLGTEAVPAAQVADALKTAHPGHRPYRSLTRDRLVAALAEHEVKVPATGNRYPVDPDAVRAARATQDDGED